MNTPSNSVDECVGQRVRVARESWNLDQAQLADALGVSIVQIVRYEGGHERIGAERLLQISRFFNVESSFFFDGWRPSGNLDASAGDTETKRPPKEAATILRLHPREHQKNSSDIKSRISIQLDHGRRHDAYEPSVVDLTSRRSRKRRQAARRVYTTPSAS